jgi:NADPH2:quinone reductase
MKAIVLHKTGGTEVLAVREIEDPVPGAGEVGVRIHYAGINYAEILSRKGLYGWAPKKPYTLGMEASGVIDNVGEGVDPSLVGQKVMVGAKSGAYAERINVPLAQTIPAIENYSMEENAAFLVNYMTSWVSLFTMARAEPGEKVLVTAAAGGVGTAAIKLASAYGCQVYGMAGSGEKVEYVKSMGAKDAFNYREGDCFKNLLSITGGVDVVLEVVGGDVFRQSLDSLKPFGRIVVAGFASLDLKKWNPYTWYRTWRDLPRTDIRKLVRKSVAVMSCHVGHLLEEEPERMQSIYGELNDFVAKHGIRPEVGRVFPFEEASRAHSFIESRKSRGKVLLRFIE